MGRYVKELLMLAAAFGLLFLGIYWLQPAPKRRTTPLKMTAGDATGLRHKLALELAMEASQAGVQIELVPSLGSEAAIEGVNRGEFDLAFVQGGLANDQAPNIRQVSAMHIEPLHLLVSAELHQRIEENGLSAIHGRRVNLGAAGSGTQILATEVLAFVGLVPASPNAAIGFHAMAYGYGELMELPQSELPDAMFTVSSLPSPLADYMIEKHDYRLVPLPFGEALALEAFLQLGKPLTNGSIDKHHVSETLIPAFTYSVTKSEPAKPLATIGTRLLLVANTKTSNEVIERLLNTLFNSRFARVDRPALDASLLDMSPEFPIHPGAAKYRQRNKPLIAGDAIDYWEKVIAITATLTGGTFFILQWYFRWSQRKREASFAAYMERVLVIQNESMQTELSAQMDLPSLIRLQRELAAIKTEAVHKFAAGELEGEGLIHGFLDLVNDARNQLTRLILHQRDNIEAQAALQNEDVVAIWNAQSQDKP